LLYCSVCFLYWYKSTNTDAVGVGVEASLLAALLERAVTRMDSFKPQEIGNTTYA
jgi:hypothetical protein